MIFTYKKQVFSLGICPYYSFNSIRAVNKPGFFCRITSRIWVILCFYQSNLSNFQGFSKIEKIVSDLKKIWLITHVGIKHFVALYFRSKILFVCPLVQLVCGIRNSRFSMFSRVKIRGYLNNFRHGSFEILSFFTLWYPFLLAQIQVFTAS